MKHERFERLARESAALLAWATQPIVLQEADEEEYVCIPVIPMEDDPVHTDEHPWCSDPKCPCHEVVTDEHMNEVYRRLIAGPLLAGLITAKEANRIFFDEQI